MKKLFPLITSIIIAQLAGIIGSLFTAANVATWYPTLIKPEWNPPSWVFGPVWITLYTLMGIAAFIIWTHKKNPTAKNALTIYGIHLALNALWSMLFFGLQNPKIAFIEIILLLIVIIVVTVRFWKIDIRAGALMIPYICWVSFASILNYMIWQLNML